MTDKHTGKRTETHACDCISRQAAIDVLGVFTQADALGHTPKQIVEALPSAQLCPKCKGIMICVSTASIPPITTYQCLACDYVSKPEKELTNCVTLPRWLWSDEERAEDEQT